ncbi:MAG: hypothetical protein IJ728_10815 [Selenomonadaceae bacterium]|nr:hypothetical protein [Selenomonadaceae bacterium]
MVAVKPKTIIAKLDDTNLSKNEYQIIIKIANKLIQNNGNVIYTRRNLAKELGIHENNLTKPLQKLIDENFIKATSINDNSYIKTYELGEHFQET